MSKKRLLKAMAAASACLCISACAGWAPSPSPMASRPDRPKPPSPHVHRTERVRIVPVVTVVDRSGKVAAEITGPGPVILAPEKVRSKHYPVSKKQLAKEAMTPRSLREPIFHHPPKARIPSTNHGGPLAVKRRETVMASLDKRTTTVNQESAIETTPVLSASKARMVSVMVETPSRVKAWRIPAGSWRLMRWSESGIELIPVPSRPRMGVGIKPVDSSLIEVVAGEKTFRLKANETVVVSAVRRDGSIEEVAVGLATKERR